MWTSQSVAVYRQQVSYQVKTQQSMLCCSGFRVLQKTWKLNSTLPVRKVTALLVEAALVQGTWRILNSLVHLKRIDTISGLVLALALNFAACRACVDVPTFLQEFSCCIADVLEAGWPQQHSPCSAWQWLATTAHTAISSGEGTATLLQSYHTIC